MKIRPKPLKENSQCPWCGTVVPTHACVCRGCNAMHCVHDRWGGMALLCFFLGLFLALYVSSGHVLLYASLLAAVGGISRWISDEGSPFWLR